MLDPYLHPIHTPFGMWPSCLQWHCAQSAFTQHITLTMTLENATSCALMENLLLSFRCEGETPIHRSVLHRQSQGGCFNGRGGHLN